MNTESTQTAIRTPRLALAGAVLAVLFCILLYDNLAGLIPLGLNVPLYLTAFYLLLGVAFGKRFRVGCARTVFHLACIFLLSITFVLFNNPVLLAINAILIILLAGEQVMLSLNQTLYDPYSIFFAGDSLALWFSFSFGGIKNAFVQYRSSGKGRLTGILIGIAVTIPVLLAVIPLLLSGDAVFHKFFTDLFGNLEWSDIVGKTLAALALFVLFSGMFWSLGNKFRTKNAPQASSVPTAKNTPFGQTASLILLFTLSTILAAFCAIQFLYLFSGRVPEGITYSEYARSGFWQLLAVAAIVITVVFLLFRFGTPCPRSAFRLRRALMSLLLGCTIILLVSSFSRMALYEQSFGFSRLRLFTQFFMVALFIFLAISILRLWLSRINLRKCAFVCFLSCYLVLAFWNVDAFIARENMKNQGRYADVAYLTTLGADALPYYIDRLDADYFATAIIDADLVPDGENSSYQYLSNGKILLYREDQVITQAYHLRHIMRDLEASYDWQYWNAGRNAARAALNKNPQLVENINIIKDALIQPR
ncbi:DUF4153 domain-containing protein [Christensenella tenuis]|jgi:hypothetical protein|uniref:DUF4173 domain-containing protein n=1 Tax=Christensenella tenuis TaxID=2763033 RepID=A0ABR7EIA9_9FIRM|nr:DUF4173 domain-containing protein [Christensenella tenuis]MBC5649512.1 DUF4173 domain-containing protein [Christensenella tenuis]